MKRSLAQIFAKAVVLELFAILAPLFNQMVVDDVLTSGDRDLLAVLVLGFALLLVVQTAIGLARGWMVMTLGQTLSLQWTGNVFAHLVRLPVEFFEKRHLGDITSRFGSVGAIQSTLTTAAISSVLDGLMAVAALADNISFFDVQPDQTRVEACATQAQLHADIVRMPMGYQTLVGDLGSGLSGGQKQRLLLARALYKQPRVLALDEATSHLDLHNERAVTAALSHLQLTRLIIAHRPETIAGAQRVVVVRDGQVTELLRSVVKAPASEAVAG